MTAMAVCSDIWASLQLLDHTDRQTRNAAFGELAPTVAREYKSQPILAKAVACVLLGSP